MGILEGLALVDRRSPHDELESTLVDGRCVDLVELRVEAGGLADRAWGGVSQIPDDGSS